MPYNRFKKCECCKREILKTLLNDYCGELVCPGCWKDKLYEAKQKLKNK